MKKWFQLLVCALVLCMMVPSVAHAQTQGGSGSPEEGDTQIPVFVGTYVRMLEKIWLSLFSRHDGPDAEYSLAFHPQEAGHLISGWNSDGEPFALAVGQIDHLDFDTIGFLSWASESNCQTATSAMHIVASNPVVSIATVQLIRELPTRPLQPPKITAMIVSTTIANGQTSVALFPLFELPGSEVGERVMADPLSPDFYACADRCNRLHPWPDPMSSHCIRGCFEHDRDDGSVMRTCEELCASVPGATSPPTPEERAACIEGCRSMRQIVVTTAVCPGRTNSCYLQCNASKSICEDRVDAWVGFADWFTTACTGGTVAVVKLAVKPAAKEAVKRSVAYWRGVGAALIAKGATDIPFEAFRNVSTRYFCGDDYRGCMKYCHRCDLACNGHVLAKFCAWPVENGFLPVPYPLP